MSLDIILVNFSSYVTSKTLKQLNKPLSRLNVLLLHQVLQLLEDEEVKEEMVHAAFWVLVTKLAHIQDLKVPCILIQIKYLQPH